MSELKVPEDLQAALTDAKRYEQIHGAKSFVGQLIERIARVEAENAALRRPVRDEEWNALQVRSDLANYREICNALILARTEAKEEGK